MAGSLKRTNTIWPGASSDRTIKTSTVPESVGDVTRSDLTPRKPNVLLKKVKDKDEIHPKLLASFQSKPITDVPKPPIQQHRDSSNGTGLVLAREKVAHFNSKGVPTCSSLELNIVVTTKKVWDLYEPLHFCTHQGHDHQHEAVLSCRKGQETRLFVLKRRLLSKDTKLVHFTRPRCEYLVDLEGAFSWRDELWLIYEEMDLPLELIFALDHDPWTLYEGSTMNEEYDDNKNRQISAIAQQVLCGIQYVHNTFNRQHGHVSTQNILLNRTGKVKLANIDLCLLGHAIENANSRTISDCKMFAKILLRLYFPLAQLEEASYNERKNDGFSDFQKHVDDGRLGQALRHIYLANAQPKNLIKLVTWAKQKVFVPLNYDPNIRSKVASLE